MFLDKWTLQIDRPGQRDEEPFESREAALQRASDLFNSPRESQIAAFTLVSPAGEEQFLQAEDMLSKANAVA